MVGTVADPTDSHGSWIAWLGEPFWVVVLPLPLDLSKHTLRSRGEETRIAPDQDELETLLYPLVRVVRGERGDARWHIHFLCGGQHLLDRFFHADVCHLSQKTHRSR